jgi:cob(I)alamin adenosyltransferase
MNKPDAQVASNGARTARKGLVILYTGKGKGKTTAALGLVLRAWGHGMRCCVIQFIKSERGRWGETLAAEKLGIAWHTLGSGFTWQSQDLAEDRRKAEEGWALAQREIANGDHDLVVLDEFTYPLYFGWLNPESVTAWLLEHKPPRLHLVITGRDAPDELVELADLVTEMTEVKHPFAQGVAAQRGIEF